MSVAVAERMEVEVRCRRRARQIFEDIDLNAVRGGSPSFVVSLRFQPESNMVAGFAWQCNLSFKVTMLEEYQSLRRDHPGLIGLAEFRPYDELTVVEVHKHGVRRI
jgi:hypothetical protein